VKHLLKTFILRTFNQPVMRNFENFKLTSYDHQI